jgi:hypothetical protein
MVSVSKPENLRGRGWRRDFIDQRASLSECLLSRANELNSGPAHGDLIALAEY